MSGTDEEAKRSEILERLEELLDRKVPIDALDALRSALDYPLQDQVELNRVALGIDSNVFMRLAANPKSADILDYLPLHGAPIILPGQAIQEFWNNRLTAVQTVSSSVKKDFDQLTKSAIKVDAQFGDFQANVTSMLDNFESEFGYIYDENTTNNISKMLEILEDQAHCYFVPRNRFCKFAEVRKLTMTPPGYKDSGHGDFFIWTDFLFGLLTCVQNGGEKSTFDKVVILTNEKKPDWSIRGTPHPILIAEIHALFGTSFDLWDLDTFGSQVQQALANGHAQRGRQR
jgi:hypothetical protein